MRGVSMLNKFRYFAGTKAAVAGLFVLALVVTAGAGIYRMGLGEAQAMARDCSTNSIIKCGIADYNELTAKYDENAHGDVRAIMDHYWIKREVQAGDRVVHGTANNRGEVVAEGRVVATNAASIGRENLGKPSTHEISINGKKYYQTSHVGGEAFANPGGSLDALIVLDAEGNFKYALVKACGNPIYAKPVEPPKPPEPKEIQVCELESKKIIAIKENEFDETKHSKNLEDCKEKEIKVCELESKQIITIKESEFDEAKHSKNLDDCKEKKIKVCELESKTIITINEDEFDKTKHSKNLKDCDEVEIKVCELESKTIVTIKESEFDEAKHSKNLADCEPKKVQVCEVETKEIITIKEDELDADKHTVDLTKCEDEPVPTPPTPTELPKTGATTSLLSAVAGISSISLASYYYAMSRRNG